MAEIAVVGPGRAGRSIGEALKECDHQVSYFGRGDDISSLASDFEIAILAVPDKSVSEVAKIIKPNSGCVVHLSGSLDLSVLNPHIYKASIHPLCTLPNADVGKKRLRSGCYFAVAGDERAKKLVIDLGGFLFSVPEDKRAIYHLGATLASNYVVALLNQALKLADELNIDKNAIINLAQGALEDVLLLGPRDALTGPAARKDDITIDLHQKIYSQHFPEFKDLFGLLVKLAQQIKDSDL
jgi:predicted short-subunit dehydrogenase-like oxidoreductase (DUF2520 family)